MFTVIMCDVIVLGNKNFNHHKVDKVERNQ
ncbi:MAG: hypothetical protein BWY08_01791 [Bacteroidetes bacterium ADurb.Bin174]|nr:MAG: hypothetical protein BWY08_01791 [Bacteroidetes bacterium ADurb.Bin174]